MPLEEMFGMPDDDYLNKELAKYRRDPAQGDNKNQGVRTYTFQSGVTTFRVLPPVAGAPAWHKDIYQHWVNTPLWRGPLTCPDIPRSGNRTCPICAKHKELLESKDEASVALADRIRRQMKVMMNILLSGQAPPKGEYEPGKVYLVMSPKSVVTDLLGYDKDEQSDFPDITGIKSAREGNGLKGRLFKVIRSGTGKTTTYAVQPTTKVIDLEDQLKEVGLGLNDLELFDLFNIYPARPISELKLIAEQIEVTDTPSVSIPELKVHSGEVTSKTFGIEPPKF